MYNTPAGGDLYLDTHENDLILSEACKRLKSSRENLGYTREQIAERAGIGVRHLAAIENGDRRPSAGVFIRIIFALGVSADQILRGTITAEDDELINQIRNCTPEQKKYIRGLVDTMLN